MQLCRDCHVLQPPPLLALRTSQCFANSFAFEPCQTDPTVPVLLKNQSKTKQNPKDTPNSELKSKHPTSAHCFDPEGFHLLFYIFVTSTLQSASRKARCRGGCYSNSSCLEKAVFTCQLRIPRSSCCAASKEQCLQ